MNEHTESKRNNLYSSNSLNQVRQTELENIEVDLLCEAVFRRYGFDYRQYARSSLKRRLRNIMAQEGLESVSALQNRVLHDKQTMEQLLVNLSVNVTSMFRDPGMFRAFREQVIPVLHTYPSIRIWHAGCASGEEAYSMSILLEEEGLGEKSTIYATDINEASIKKAKAGIIPMDSMQEYTNNYQSAGGTRSFSQYYTAKYNHAKIRHKILNRIVFSRHNLATDCSFNEFNVILCRNVMIYFNQDLQARVHQLMRNSLCRFGILVLGNQESIKFTPQERSYKELITGSRVYQQSL